MNKKYKFYVYPGNNGNLIKKCLLERGNWEEVLFEFNLITIFQN